MTHNLKTDAELISDVLAGDRRAFTLIMARHKEWLYLFIRRHVRSPDDAYDVLQDSFAAAWRALSRYDPERPLEAWLRRIALNKCRDHARSAGVWRRFFAPSGTGADLVEYVPDPAAPAHATQIAGQAVRRLQAAIAALPAQLREPLVLTAVQGLSQSEAGEALGVSAKTIETRVYRARKRLAAVLDPSDADDIAAQS